MEYTAFHPVIQSDENKGAPFFSVEGIYSWRGTMVVTNKVVNFVCFVFLVSHRLDIWTWKTIKQPGCL